MSVLERNHPDTPRAVRYWAIALALAFLVLYTFSASWTVIVDHDDAALFQAVGVAGGIPHQPYPLFCVVSRCFALLPVGEPAFRVTLVSIVFASLTIAALFLLLVRLTANLLISAVACVVLGLSCTFWHNAALAEVYAMNSFMVVVFLSLAIRLYARFDTFYWYPLMLVLGFLVSHHQSNIALFPATALIAYWQRESIRRDLEPRHWLASVLVFLLPFTLYAYTYFVDKGSYPVNWFDTYGRHVYVQQGGDPDRFEHFFERLRYQMFIGRYNYALPDLKGLAVNAYTWARAAGGWEFPFLAPFVILIGFLSSLKRSPRESLLWLVVALPYVAVSLLIFGGTGTEKYSIPAFMVFAVFLAEGLAWLERAPWRSTRLAKPILLIVAVLIMVVPILRYSVWSEGLISSQSAVSGSTSRGRIPLSNLASGNDHGRVFGDWVSQHIQPGSLIFGGFARTNVLLYRKYGLGDLEGVDVRYRRTRDAMAAIVAETRPERVYFTPAPDQYGLRVDEVTPIVGIIKLYRVDLSEFDLEPAARE
jgi:hypothetical protein